MLAKIIYIILFIYHDINVIYVKVNDKYTYGIYICKNINIILIYA